MMELGQSSHRNRRNRQHRMMVVVEVVGVERKLVEVGMVEVVVGELGMVVAVEHIRMMELMVVEQHRSILLLRLRRGMGTRKR